MEATNSFIIAMRLLLIWLVLSGLFLYYKTTILLITKKQILGVFSRLIVSWLMLFFACTLFHVSISNALLPFFTLLLNHLQNDYIASLSLLEQTTQAIQIDVTLLREIHPFISGTKYFQYFHLLAFLQTLVLVPAILFAWPVKRALSRVFLVLLSIPLSVFSLMINVPFQMAYSFETTFAKLAKINDAVRPEPFYHLWVLFMINGGNLIIIVLGVVLATALQKKYLSFQQLID